MDRKMILAEVKVGLVTGCAYYYVAPDSFIYISFIRPEWVDGYTYPTKIVCTIPLNDLETWLTNEMQYIDEKLGANKLPYNTQVYFGDYYGSKTISDLIPNAKRFIVTE